MMNGLTSPSEVLNDVISSSTAAAAAAKNKENNSNNNNNAPATRRSSILLASNNSEHRNVTFNFSGIQLAVPYKITVCTESTADPAGAEKHAKKLIDEIFSQVAKYSFSNFEQYSEVGKINHNEVVNATSSYTTSSTSNNNTINDSACSNDNTHSSEFEISENLENLLFQAQDAARGTNNVFNPVVTASSSKNKNNNSNLTWDDSFSLSVVEKKHNNHVRSVAILKKKNPEAQLDLCGIAKGWIVDSICCSLISCGFSGVLVDWGGDIKAQGQNLTSTTTNTGHNTNNNEWTIGLEKSPEPPSSSSSSKIATTITLCDSSCATSGNYKQEKEHLRCCSSSSASSSSSPFKIAAVTVVHPSAATADALATFYYCHLSNFIVSSSTCTPQALEEEITKSCESRTTDSSSSSSSIYGQEMNQVIVQYFDSSNTYKIFEWNRKRRSSSQQQQASSAKNNNRATVLKEVALKNHSAALSANPAKLLEQNKEITDNLRRSLLRMVAVIFVRIDHSFILGCTLSSGSLLSTDYFNCQKTASFAGKSSSSSSSSSSSAIFLFSAMKNSRLFNLLVNRVNAANGDDSSSSSKNGEFWLFLPRVNISLTSPHPQHPSPKTVAIMSEFASGKMITLTELERIQNLSTSNEEKCKLFSGCTLKCENSLGCGDHGVFVLDVLKNTTNTNSNSSSSASELSLFFNPTISTSPVLRSGRNYVSLPSPATTAPSSPGTKNAKIASAFPTRLNASKSLFQQFLNPATPSTCGIFTRMAKGQFFGVTCTNIEFVSTTIDSSSNRSGSGITPVLQLVCPVNELSMASLGDIFSPQQQQSGSSPPSFRLKLHIFGQHPDAESLLKWFADPSFMSVGNRTEHFMYLPAAADHEDAERYSFPGTVGKGAGAIYTLNCDIVFVDKISSGLLLLLVQPDFSSRENGGALKSFVNEASNDFEFMKPTLWWN